MKSDEEHPVRHDVAASRYEIDVGGQLAVADYRIDGEKIIFTHTFVPPEYRSRGLAEKLVRRALNDARDQNLRVVPACSYVAAFIQRHAEYRPLLAG